MKLSFRERGLLSFDASAVAMEASKLSTSERDASDFGGARAPRITSLDISNNRIHTLMGIAMFLPHLRELDMSHNHLRSVSKLPHGALTRLNISHNRITTLSGLENLVHLVYLDASHNEIESINGAEQGRLPDRLEQLNLSQNAIVSTDGLGHLIRLNKLSLHNNSIRSLEALADLSGARSLRHLTIRGNPVANHAKVIPLLEATVRRLTTVDGMPLTQAAATLSHKNSVNKELAEASSARRSRSRHVSFETLQATTTASDDIYSRELRSMEARVRELESLAKQHFETEQRLNKELSLARAQVKRTQEIYDQQLREVTLVREAIQQDAETVASQERTLASLHQAYEQQHALIVAKKLDAYSIQQPSSSK